MRWQIQYTGEISTDLELDVFNLDLFDTPSETIAKLHERGVFVMCYFSAGSYEDWRPDAQLFPSEVLGNDMAEWPGEKWLDIRRIDLLAPIMQARLDLAVSKGCDGVDPDNVNGYTNDTGFPLTAEDQKRYNLFLAEAAHQRGLLVGLKNDLEQIPDLLAYFDWIINEECFSYGECELLLPFVQAGKPVFVIEYELEPSDFCPQALQMNFNALRKNWELDAYRVDCREWSAHP
ncbi:MAG: endo alpha-1,4 polygalactosaminidase [Anaerolineales bacterium]